MLYWKKLLFFIKKIYKSFIFSGLNIIIYFISFLKKNHKTFFYSVILFSEITKLNNVYKLKK